MKAFAAVAAPDDHPFWTADEGPQPPLDRPVAQPPAGWILDRDENHAVALSGKRSSRVRFVEQTAAKYEKFAYSSRYGFAGEVEFHWGAPMTDSTIVLVDGTDRQSRSRVEEAFIQDDPVDGPMLWSRWRPWPDVVVDTVLAGGATCHHRLHLIRTGRALSVVETGFAVAVESIRLTEGSSDVEVVLSDGAVEVRTVHDRSGLVDGDGSRTGSVRPLPPNAGMLAPSTAVPVLQGDLEPGEYVLSCTVWAGPTGTGSGSDQLPVPPVAARVLLEHQRDRATEPHEEMDVEALLGLRFAGKD